jgi:RNase P subunit RPR2
MESSELISKNSKKATRCNCMASITGMSEPTAVQVIDYLYGFALLTKAAQQTLVKEWIKYTKNIAKAYKHHDHRKRYVFLLHGTTNLICKNALCRLLGMGLLRHGKL